MKGRTRNYRLITQILTCTLLALGICSFLQPQTLCAQTKKKTTSAKPVVHQGPYKVVGVKDGDTYVFLVDGRELVVRLAHIDCPEKNQAYGTAAKKFGSDMCFGKMVRLKHTNEFDRNQRLIAEIILPDGRNLNKLLVQNGLAWHFKKYSKDEEYARLEIRARNKKVGLWSQPAVAPWEWRAQRRSKK